MNGKGFSLVLVLWCFVLSKTSEDGTEFDWFMNFEHLKPYLIPHLSALTGNKENLKILILGCGNSSNSLNPFLDPALSSTMHSTIRRFV
jgi:hypothetical protein